MTTLVWQTLSICILISASTFSTLLCTIWLEMKSTQKKIYVAVQPHWTCDHQQETKYQQLTMTSLYSTCLVVIKDYDTAFDALTMSLIQMP